MKFSQKINRAVKAELARNDITGTELATVLALGRNATYARLRGKTPFNTGELDKITKYIGIDILTLCKSAELDNTQPTTTKATK